MRSEKDIRKQLDNAQTTLEMLNKDTDPGLGFWRRTKGYIEALEWVLENDRLRDGSEE